MSQPADKIEEYWYKYRVARRSDVIGTQVDGEHTRHRDWPWKLAPYLGLPHQVTYYTQKIYESASPDAPCQQRLAVSSAP